MINIIDINHRRFISKSYSGTLIIEGNAEFSLSSNTIRFLNHSETLNPSLLDICSMILFILGVTLVAIRTVFGLELFLGIFLHS